MPSRCLVGLLVLGLVGGCGPDRSSAFPELATLESKRLADLIAPVPDREASEEAVATYWHGLVGKVPIVEAVPGDARSCLVSFVSRGNSETERVAILGCPTEPDVEPMRRLGATDLWYRSVRVPSAVRFSYRFQTNGPATLPDDLGELALLERDHPPQLDPLNPRRPGDVDSLVTGPAAPPEPWLKVQPDIKHGSVQPTALYSRTLGEPREVALYTPAGWQGKGQATPVVVVLDGEMYGRDDKSAISVPTMLDNLIAAGKIPPTVAVLVAAMDGSRRLRDMYGSDDFAGFLATELIPWVETEAGIQAEGDRTVVVGSSAGGVAAAYAGLKQPAVFGNIVALSGAFVFGPGQKYSPAAPPADEYWLSHQCATAAHLSAHWYLAVGQFERRTTQTDYLAASRRLRAVLQAHQVAVTYHEVLGGHDPAWWGGSLADALQILLGKPLQ